MARGIRALKGPLAGARDPDLQTEDQDLRTPTAQPLGKGTGQRKLILADVPSVFPQIKPLPGMVQRWVRARIMQAEDVDNVSARQAEGWEARRGDTLPKGVHAPILKSGEYQGCICVRSQILMHRPADLDEAYHERDRNNAAMQLDYVQRKLEESHEPGRGLGRPKMKIKTEVGVRRSRPASIQDDEEEAEEGDDA